MAKSFRERPCTRRATTWTSRKKNGAGAVQRSFDAVPLCIEPSTRKEWPRDCVTSFGRQSKPGARVPRALSCKRRPDGVGGQTNGAVRAAVVLHNNCIASHISDAALPSENPEAEFVVRRNQSVSTCSFGHARGKRPTLIFVIF